MKSITKIFMLSGLGADKRVFDFLSLKFIDSVIHVEWIDPIKKESLQAYAGRLIEKYNIEENSIVIGLSFGGIIAVEISKQVKLLKTIIISSARNKFDLPLSYRILGKLGLVKLIPKKGLNKRNHFLEKGFGASSLKEKQLLRSVIEDTNTDFAKWAIIAISNWDEENQNDYVLRIHGTNDKIIPLKNKVDYIIENAGHLMINQRALEINEILNKEVAKLLDFNSK